MELDEVAHTPLTLPQPSLAVSDEISTYAELQQQIHRALRVQHPEWVKPNGDSPLCDGSASTTNGGHPPIRVTYPGGIAGQTT
jgi:hypothetical protein